MNYGRIKTRLAASVLATALAPAFALGAAYTAGIAEAQAAKRADCEVNAILASKDGERKLPKNLEFLRETLEADEFAIYKSFHLLEKKALALELDKPASARFGSGHKLLLTLLGSKGKKLKYHFYLSGRDGKKKLFDADLSIEDAGLFMTGVGDYKSPNSEVSGKLFFAIQCASKKAKKSKK